MEDTGPVSYGNLPNADTVQWTVFPKSRVQRTGPRTLQTGCVHKHAVRAGCQGPKMSPPGPAHQKLILERGRQEDGATHVGEMTARTQVTGTKKRVACAVSRVGRTRACVLTRLVSSVCWVEGLGRAKAGET